MKEEEITYIAKRYHKGRFSIDDGWKRLNIATSFSTWRFRIIAAVASAVVLSAAAAIIYHRVSAPQSRVEEQTSVKPNPKEKINVIDFESASLPVVIAKIKDVYGVEVTNLPDNADSYNLSLHYEGNSVDLIAIINDILGTNMSIKE